MGDNFNVTTMNDLVKNLRMTLSQSSEVQVQQWSILVNQLIIKGVWRSENSASSSSPCGCDIGFGIRLLSCYSSGRIYYI